ncbi:MarR family winged helix-turn-helix transcriptional regulator [Methylobacterium sp. J-026]|uniref:MarR family winged helix-turn-helix transcriptional regulator n=1 Tax=Methylobacterium sp. J-026 TaxID=2836624 RepID=UPI001FB8E9C8|nr:MarR family winged helix-turn-helix transcriptional regulator [Methylobacterium sp. J-026]MCJ2133060.1 MarR family winged helix-turn-helix transcriptional regulator [Methylobacterium sp. J-026]
MTDDPSTCSNAVLRQAMRRIGQLYDDALAPSGLRATQHGLLATVRTMGAPTMRELAERAVMDLSGLSHTLKPLTRDGYLQLVPDPRDRRARRITLTVKGENKLAETAKLWRGAQDRFEAVFGKERAVALKAELGFLISPAFQDAFNKAGTETATSTC